MPRGALHSPLTRPSPLSIFVSSIIPIFHGEENGDREAFRSEAEEGARGGAFFADGGLLKASLRFHAQICACNNVLTRGGRTCLLTLEHLFCMMNTGPVAMNRDPGVHPPPSPLASTYASIRRSSLGPLLAGSNSMRGWPNYVTIKLSNYQAIHYSNLIRMRARASRLDNQETSRPTAQPTRRLSD